MEYGLNAAFLVTSLVSKVAHSFEIEFATDDEEWHYAYDNDSECRDEINNYLRQMSHDGTLKKLQEKWMEDYAMDRSLPAVYHRYHIFYIGYTIAFLVFAGVMYLYRKNVRRQSAYIDALLAYQNKLKSLVEDQFSHQDSSLSPRIAHTGEDGIRGFHVLVVDNNTLSQEILIATLKDAGATASTASSGKEAIRAFEKSDLNTFDAILMDLVMPGMDGFATTKAIRALPRVDALTIPIIAVTANTYQDIEDEVHAAGMNARSSTVSCFDEASLR